VEDESIRIKSSCAILCDPGRRSFRIPFYGAHDSRRAVEQDESIQSNANLIQMKCKSDATFSCECK